MNYHSNGIRLSETTKEKDLGAIISNDRKPNQQCTEIVKSANKLIGLLGHTFEHKSEKAILAVYNSLLRPHLEYCVQFLSPYYRKELENLRGYSVELLKRFLDWETNRKKDGHN